MNLLITKDYARWGDFTFPYVAGRNGFTRDKREGDGKTPIGEFPFRAFYYRKDRIAPPLTKLDTHIITPKDGWCDDPLSPYYNKYIMKPFEASHEDLWLDRNLYDLMVVLGYNDYPSIQLGKGSAIFLHIAPENGESTAGCIGLKKEDLLKVVENATHDSKVIIDI